MIYPSTCAEERIDIVNATLGDVGEIVGARTNAALFAHAVSSLLLQSGF
jgi:hypothetical protein